MSRLEGGAGCQSGIYHDPSEGDSIMAQHSTHKASRNGKTTTQARKRRRAEKHDSHGFDLERLTRELCSTTTTKGA